MELTRGIDEAPNKVSNSPAQTHAYHAVFEVAPYSSPIDHPGHHHDRCSMSFITTRYYDPAITTRCDHVGQMMRIHVLPDDVLLEIFEVFMLIMKPSWGVDKRGVESWQSLVHVCRRWRNLVFESPRRLNLQLFCTPETRAKETLHVWPAFLPLIVKGNMDVSSRTDNVISALEQTNRVRQVDLYLEAWQLAAVLGSMQVSFPELTNLRLWSLGETRVIPDSFLGKSAPHLRILHFYSIPFPGLPKLLLTATHLVQLYLHCIPHSGYISPKTMAALVSVLSRLESLHLEFPSPLSRPDWESQNMPSSERSVLPALHEFCFKGFTEYLEEFVTDIDTPELDRMEITFFNQVDFDCPRLVQFIDGTPIILRALDEAHVQFHYSTASVALRYRTSKPGSNDLRINISNREPDWQPSSLAQVLDSSLPPRALSMVEDLYIKYHYWQTIWEDDAIENTLWLELLHPFTAVKNLYISREFAPGIGAALQELVDSGITEMLPSLQNVFVEELMLSGLFQENIRQFVAARQFSNHPITISVWDKYSDSRWSI